jgi:hypothetical protein
VMWQHEVLPSGSWAMSFRSDLELSSKLDSYKNFPLGIESQEKHYELSLDLFRVRLT